MLFHKVERLLTIIEIKNLIFGVSYIITSVVYVFFVMIGVIAAVKIIIVVINFRKLNLI